ncbi:MAG: hypothetical protein N3F64_07595 [Nitrososphaeria archaeon]|nr:hypothetical protein [Nitrososphaeria archaeon]
MSDIINRVKDERTLLEKITSYVPGYHGYKEKELRREADKIVREYLINKLNNIKMILNDVFKEIADTNDVESFSTANRVSATLDRLINKIQHANYGYSGFFDAVKVKEDKLDKLIEFDYTIIENIKSLNDTANNILVQEDKKKALEDFRKKLIELENTFNKRNDIIFEVIK